MKGEIIKTFLLRSNVDHISEIDKHFNKFKDSRSIKFPLNFDTDVAFLKYGTGHTANKSQLFNANNCSEAHKIVVKKSPGNTPDSCSASFSTL